MTYQDIRAELSRRCSSIRHFNRAFFATYKKSLYTARKNSESGIDDNFLLAPGVIGKKSFIPVYDTKFYKENGPAYCEFLCIVYGVF